MTHYLSKSTKAVGILLCLLLMVNHSWGREEFFGIQLSLVEAYQEYVWPDSSFEEGNSPFYICFFEKNNYLFGFTIGNRKIQKKMIPFHKRSAVLNKGVCHILYVNSEEIELNKTSNFLASLNGKPVLTVCEIPALQNANHNECIWQMKVSGSTVSDFNKTGVVGIKTETLLSEVNYLLLGHSGLRTRNVR